MHITRIYVHIFPEKIFYQPVSTHVLYIHTYTYINTYKYLYMYNNCISISIHQFLYIYTHIYVTSPHKYTLMTRPRVSINAVFER